MEDKRVCRIIEENICVVDGYYEVCLLKIGKEYMVVKYCEVMVSDVSKCFFWRLLYVEK